MGRRSHRQGLAHLRTSTTTGSKTEVCTDTATLLGGSPLTSSDSGLEAFSRDPTRGSFAALTFPSTACTDDVP
jgi:hypothetical protein